MHVRSAHVATWLDDHEHVILEKGHSQEFNAALSRLPWTVSSVRWAVLPHKELELPDNFDDREFWEEFRSSPAGNHEFVFIMYAGREPGIVCRTRDAIPDLDYLYSGAPGSRYFCGADLSDEGPVLEFDDFAEYDGNGLIKVHMRPDSGTLRL